MASTSNEVTAVQSLDLDHYLGTWFEICRLPLKWEDDEASDITATYSKDDSGHVRVENRCLDKSGKPIRSIGEAVPIDETNAKLKVSFLPKYLRWIPFAKGNYWVLRIAPDYSFALVGTPDHKHLWLLSRTPALFAGAIEDCLATAKAQGFDLMPLITPLQSGRIVPNSAFGR